MTARIIDESPKEHLGVCRRPWIGNNGISQVTTHDLSRKFAVPGHQQPAYACTLAQAAPVSTSNAGHAYVTLIRLLGLCI